jgi:hypothetical protein
MPDVETRGRTPRVCDGVAPRALMRQATTQLETTMTTKTTKRASSRQRAKRPARKPKPTYRVLTLQMLERARACEQQRALFQTKFGPAVAVTTELCVSHAQDFGFGWAGTMLLPKSAAREFDRLVADKVRACGVRPSHEVCTCAEFKARTFASLYVEKGGRRP